MRMRQRMAIEINMRIEVLAFAVLMGATTKIMRVIEQIRNTGDTRDQTQEIGGLDQIVKSGVGRTQPADLFDDRLIANLAVFVQCTLGIESRKFGEQSGGRSLIEEMVDNDMTERFTTLKSSGEFDNRACVLAEIM